jgi:UDP-N-acetyl-D-glucosamine dehydrogenase
VRDSKVAILGLGYVGLPLAVAAQESGVKVIGVDSSEERVSKLLAGESYIEDVSNANLSSALENGFAPTTNTSLISECEIIVICVPTPVDENNKPNLSAIIIASEMIANFAPDGALIINESTSFPGTVRNFIPSVISRIRPEANFDFAVAPERVDPGNTKWNHRNTPRLVSGVTESARIRARDFYSRFCKNVVIVSTPEVAEMSKLLENTFRQVNIALVNQLVPLAKEMDVDIFEVVEAAATKPYGFMPFYPGIGVGGHCIPVDPMYLSWSAAQRNINMSLINSAQQINNSMPGYVATLIKGMALTGQSRILIVGLAYKPGVSDLRESPSLDLIKNLKPHFERVDWWDERIKTWNGEFCSEFEENFDLIVVTHKVKDRKVLEAISRAVHVIDCTGQFRGQENVKTF